LPPHLRASSIDAYLHFQDGTGEIALVDEVAAHQECCEPVGQLELRRTLDPIRRLPLGLGEYRKQVDEVVGVHQPSNGAIGVELELCFKETTIVGDENPHGFGLDARAQLTLCVVDAPSNQTALSVKVEGKEVGQDVVDGGGLWGGLFAHRRRFPRTTDIRFGH
jgi:hypothetical protein